MSRLSVACMKQATKLLLLVLFCVVVLLRVRGRAVGRLVCRRQLGQIGLRLANLMAKRASHATPEELRALLDEPAVATLGLDEDQASEVIDFALGRFVEDEEQRQAG